MKRSESSSSEPWVDPFRSVTEVLQGVLSVVVEGVLQVCQVTNVELNQSFVMCIIKRTSVGA